MSDIRFNRWLHQSGTGGVYQDGSGRVGIGSSTPTEALDIVGVASATSFFGPLTGNVTGDVTSSGTSTFDVISGVSTIGVTTVHLTDINNLSYPTAGPLSNRNLIVNGSMMVSQRSTSLTGQTGGGYKCLDRFRIGKVNLGTWTFTQSGDAPVGFSSSFKCECTTAAASPAAGDLFNIQHRMEGRELQVLKKGTSSAENFTVSFWVKSNKTGTYNLQAEDLDNTRSNVRQYSIESADTWEHKKLTFDGDTTGSLDKVVEQSFRLIWWLGSGTNYSSGTTPSTWEAATATNHAVGNVNLADSNNNEFYITGIQMETGSVATPFEHRSYGDELARCQRYYYKLIADSGRTFANGYNQNARYTRNILHFPVSMRIPPTALEQTGTAANYRIYHGTTENACSGVPTLNSSTTNTAEIQADTGSGLTAGQGNALESNSNGTYLAFTAEL